MANGTIKINTEKLLPIIKKWLYSDKEIFLRELVSNACDALSKLKILRDQKEASYEDQEMRIAIRLDQEKKTLTITDTGIGMTHDEVEKYIAQLAFSGAEEFLSQYKSSEEKDQVIGHFGLGFYSAYMVAQKVEIQTLSYKSNDTPTFWSCDGTSDYIIDQGSRKERGTEITLFLEDEEFLQEGRIKDLLMRYCSFLPYPIYLNDTHINHKDPLWLKSPTDCTDEEYLEFYRQLHPLEPDPVFWVHLNVDYPFHLKGILYFPKIDRRFDFQKSHLKLFCNRVYVSDNCQDLLPEYLTVLRGCIDSPDIPLNVSRSYLQMDATVRSLSKHISKKVADRLAGLYRNDPKAFESKWDNIETILKLGIIHDDKFYERVKEFLIWKTTSETWTTLEAYLEKQKETIYYTQDEHSPFLALYKQKNIDVIIAKGPLDTPLMNFLETKLESAKFKRIDGSLDSALLDPSKEKTLLDQEGQTEREKMAQFFRSHLSEANVEVEAKSLSSDTLPAFILLDEQTRRIKETLSLSSQQLPPGFEEKKTFVVNTNSPLIQSLTKQSNPDLAKTFVQQLYQLAKLSQKELSTEELPSFVENTYKLWEKLV